MHGFLIQNIAWFARNVRGILRGLIFLYIGQMIEPTAATKASSVGFVYGSQNAPQHIIEFSSLTCPHCAIFHQKILPEILNKYVDTGQLRLTCRDYPDNELAMQATLLVHCAPTAEESLKLRELLFSKQSYWMMHSQPWETMCKIVKPFLHTSPESCVSNQALYQKVMQEVMDGYHQYKITHTPSFIFENKIYPKALTLQELEVILSGGDPHIKTVRSLDQPLDTPSAP